MTMAAKTQTTADAETQGAVPAQACWELTHQNGLGLFWEGGALRQMMDRGVPVMDSVMENNVLLNKVKYLHILKP